MKSNNNKLVKNENVQKKKAKKKHTFACCFTSIILSLVLVVGGVFGTLFFLYESYARPITNMSFSEAITFGFGLYGANDEKVVTNPYNQKSESKKFFVGLSDSLHIDKILKIEDLISGFNQIKPGEPITPPEQGGDGTGNSFLDQLLKDAHFDFSNLNDFDGSEYAGFMISDKMLAAVMQDTLDIAEQVPELKKIQDELGVELSKLLRVKQVIVTANEQNNDNSTLKLTLGLNTKTLADSMLKKAGLSAGLIGLVKGFLPTTIYFSCTITPMANSAPTLQINTIDEELMGKAVIAIDNIMAKTGSKQNLTSILNTVGKTLYDVFNKVETLAGEGSIVFGNYNDQNGLAVDTLQIIMKSMGVENVSTNEFLLMIKHLHSYDLSGESLEDFIKTLDNYSTIEDFYTSRNDLFLTYGISPQDAELFTPNNFMQIANTIPQYVNMVDSKINGVNLYKYSQEELKKKAIFSDKALAQIFGANLSSELQKSGNALKMTILELSLKEEDMVLIASIDIKGAMNPYIPDSPIKPLLMSLFPEQLYAKITVPYIQNPSGISSNIIFNYGKDTSSSGEQLSDHMLKTLSSIIKAISPENANMLDKNEICKQLDTSLYKSLDEIEKLESEHGIKIEFGVGHLIMPTCYELISSKTKGEDGTVMPPEEVHLALQDMYSIDPYLENGVPIDNLKDITLDNFIDRELVNKMYFNKGVFTSNNLFNELTNLSTLINSSNIDKSININALVNNNKPISNQDKFYMESLEFGKFISQSHLTSELDKLLNIYSNARIINTIINNYDRLIITTCSELNKSALSAKTELDIDKLAPKYLFFNIAIDLNNPQNEIIISMNSASSNKETERVLKLMSSLAGNPVSLDSIKNTINKEMNVVFGDLEKSNIKLKSIRSESQNGIIGNNVYDMLAYQLPNYTVGADELLRKTLYGLNNFDNFIKLSNIPDVEPQPEIDLVNKTATISDTFIGYHIKKQHSQNTPNLVKTALLKNGTTTLNNYLAHFGTKIEGKDLLATTFELEKTSFNLTSDSVALKLIPDKLYLSIFMNVQDTNDYTYTVNSLDNECVTYLESLFRADNSNSIKDNLDKAVNNVKNASFTIQGISIKFTELINSNSVIQSQNGDNGIYGKITTSINLNV